MSKKVKKGGYLDILLRSPKSIFTTKDVALLWSEDNTPTIKEENIIFVSIAAKNL